MVSVDDMLSLGLDFLHQSPAAAEDTRSPPRATGIVERVVLGC